MLAGVNKNFVTKLLEAGCDPTIATYDGGFMTTETEVKEVQCRGRDIKIYLLYIIQNIHIQSVFFMRTKVIAY